MTHFDIRINFETSTLSSDRLSGEYERNHLWITNQVCGLLMARRSGPINDMTGRVCGMVTVEAVDLPGDTK